MSSELAESIKWETTNSRQHFHAHCWKLSLQFDGKTFFWTDYQHSLTLWDGVTYTKQEGGDSSAREALATLEPANKTLKGFAKIDLGAALTSTEIRNGALVGAYLDEYVVDYRTPWLAPVDFVRYFVKSATYDASLWQLECEGLTYVFEDQIGEYWGPFCRAELFSQGLRKCNLNQSAYTTFSAVDAVYTGSTNRVQFRCNAVGPLTDPSYANDGKVYFQTGANVGRWGIVKQWDIFSPGIALCSLQQPLPYPIAIGDSIIVYPGCDKTISTCASKFGNSINFQGEPYIPGGDAARRGISTRF